ncbi:uncharacterized protein LY79DRAFT_6395 [Colletotrichum navitas]|uniref:Uncharacterized protein n=1 Tax=Colletotrichum navitas TaxID=681940 RepID=A0AAD8QD17_9PEZI|nr:uncharacterized protein LY79DRAFT_6395 [Colletotrichum navitas]KAK1600100.1 hypothetical protein LY79DRAFT_6395 [Colletotrichum navitas]
MPTPRPRHGHRRTAWCISDDGRLISQTAKVRGKGTFFRACVYMCVYMCARVYMCVCECMEILRAMPRPQKSYGALGGNYFKTPKGSSEDWPMLGLVAWWTG